MGKRLNQLLAIDKDVKQQISKDLAKLNHVSQNEALYDGLFKTYVPNEEEGDQLPSESKVVQVRSTDVLESLAHIIKTLVNITASKDATNMNAIADIKIDGLVIEKLPAVHLLWLEKHLEEVHTFITKLPTLDPSAIWKYDENQNCMATEPVVTVREKKIPRNHVKAAATKEHPAQVEIYMESVPAGRWSTIRYSGKISVERQRYLLERIRTLQQAVKQARESANMVDVVERKIGNQIADWLLQ